MDRRALFTGMGMAVAAAALAGCAGNASLPSIPVQVSVSLPPELQGAVDDVNAIIAKVDSLRTTVPATVMDLVAKAKAFIARLDSQNAVGTVGELVHIAGSIASLIAPQYATIATAIETLLPVIGSVIGMRMAARRSTGMSPAQARAVLRS